MPSISYYNLRKVDDSHIAIAFNETSDGDFGVLTQLFQA